MRDIKLKLGECLVDLYDQSDADLLDRIRKESGKLGSAVYSDWVKRPNHWYLDYLEITKTKYGEYRLWDIERIDTIKIFTSLKAAKNHGLKLINQRG